MPIVERLVNRYISPSRLRIRNRPQATRVEPAPPTLQSAQTRKDSRSRKERERETELNGARREESDEAESGIRSTPLLPTEQNELTTPLAVGATKKSLMMNGRNNGKKQMAVRIVAHAFEIVHLLTDQNPIQVLVDAIVNTGPREDSTRIGSQGTVRRQAVDVSPLRRVNQAIALITIGVRPPVPLCPPAFTSCAQLRPYSSNRSASLRSATSRPSPSAVSSPSLPGLASSVTLNRLRSFFLPQSPMSSSTLPRDPPTLTPSRRRSQFVFLPPAPHRFRFADMSQFSFPCVCVQRARACCQVQQVNGEKMQIEKSQQTCLKRAKQQKKPKTLCVDRDAQRALQRHERRERESLHHVRNETTRTATLWHSRLTSSSSPSCCSSNRP